ncbi:HD-GYP domain-containing protein (c-di-GMP phosphodiesterase class II) [Azospirillum canadense]|nr:HD-GYP domain-containing protein (c-di-GMP phosphodiesterase class II) [Azospirillum canadense]
MLRNIVGCHHERWDGTGYPNGLAGASIPLEGRIVAVADVFDALTSERPYKIAWTFEAAAFLRDQAGRHFDPACVDALLADPGALSTIRHRFREEPFATRG